MRLTVLGDSLRVVGLPVWLPPHFAEKTESFWMVVEPQGIPQGWCFLLASLGLLSLS